MNVKLSLQKIKSVFFLQSVLLVLIATVDKATAAINIKDTNYSIPSGAYFVSPDGKSTNSGDASSPWSVAKALTSAPSGATIVFRGGTYRDVAANINKKLTLQAYPHEQAWIKGSVVVTGWVADSGIWRKDGWTYSFPLTKQITKSLDTKNYPLAGHRDMVYINGVALRQVASKAKVTAKTFYVNTTNNQLYIGSNPAGKTVEATKLKQALTIAKSGAYTVVRGLGFAHYADRGITASAPHVTLESSTFAWNGLEGVMVIGKNSATDAILRGNTFSYNGRKGLGGVYADRMLVENNTISHNNIENFAKTWDAAGVKVIWTNGLTWRNNIVEDNFATGMWVDGSSTNATVVKNTVRNNGSIGIQFEVSHKAIIAANLIHNNPAGIMVADSSSARIYNNTLSMNGKDVVFKDSTRKNSLSSEIAQGITWVTRNNTFKNNILSNTTAGVLIDAAGCETKVESKLMITAVNLNAYYRTSSSQTPSLIKWSLGAGNCALKYANLATFKAATGYEANGIAIDNNTTNPFFVNAATGDYRLKAGSVAIGRGQALPADVASAIGVAAGVGVDLGALQSKVTLVH